MKLFIFPFDKVGKPLEYLKYSVLRTMGNLDRDRFPISRVRGILKKKKPVTATNHPRPAPCCDVCCAVLQIEWRHAEAFFNKNKIIKREFAHFRNKKDAHLWNAGKTSLHRHQGPSFIFPPCREIKKKGESFVSSFVLLLLNAKRPSKWMVGGGDVAVVVGGTTITNDILKHFSFKLTYRCESYASTKC